MTFQLLCNFEVEKSWWGGLVGGVLSSVVNDPKWSQLVPYVPKISQIDSTGTKWSQMVPHDPKWSQVILTLYPLSSRSLPTISPLSPNYLLTFPHFRPTIFPISPYSLFTIYPHSLKWSQIPDGLKWSYMVQDGPRWSICLHWVPNCPVCCQII